MLHTSIHSGIEFDRRPVRVLSLGSQLLYGSVGNNAGNQIYFEAGVRRVALPSVILSSLPHYQDVQFQDVNDSWLSASFEQLEAIGVIEQLRYVTVGYLVRPQQAEIIAEKFQRWQKRYPNIELLLDPTIGDYDVGIYTNPGIVEAHRDILLPHATGVVPNLFELEQLAGMQVNALDPASPITLARSLFEIPTVKEAKNLSWIIVTSSNHTNLPDRPLPETENDRAQQSGRQRPGLRFVEDTVISRDGSWETFSHDLVKTRAKGAGDQFLAKLTVALLNDKTLHDAIVAARGTVADGLSLSVSDQDEN